MPVNNKPYAKDDVDYGAGDIDGEHCGACEHFIEPVRCEIVYGKIRSGGWCCKWTPKGGETEKKAEGDGDGKEVSKG